MSAMSDAVSKGPRATSAKTAHIEAQIKLAEAKAKRAKGRAASHRRKAAKNGPLAGFYKTQSHVWDRVAEDEQAKADKLRTDLARAKADEAARNVKHVKRTVASTAAEGLTPKAAAQGGQPGRAKAGQGKRGGQPSQPKTGQRDQTAKGPADSESPPGQPTCSRCGRHVSRWVYRKGKTLCDLCWRPEDDDLGHGKCTVPERVEKRGSIYGRVRADGTRSIDAGSLLGYQTVPCGAWATAADGLCDRHRNQPTAAANAAPTPIRPQPKGTPAMPVSGEAVDIETTEAMLADLKTKVADMRATFDNAGGSLAKIGLNKLANALNKADDALGSVDTGIVDAERELAPHKDIADIAQSTGEMASSASFYGV